MGKLKRRREKALPEQLGALTLFSPGCSRAQSNMPLFALIPTVCDSGHPRHLRPSEFGFAALPPITPPSHVAQQGHLYAASMAAGSSGHPALVRLGSFGHGDASGHPGFRRPDSAETLVLPGGGVERTTDSGSHLACLTMF